MSFFPCDGFHKPLGARGFSRIHHISVRCVSKPPGANQYPLSNIAGGQEASKLFLSASMMVG